MKLSIITINYNNLAGLRRTIDSVLAQTWHDFEWIVIDGGSTDGSRELIEQYQEHFAYWCSEKDRGVYHAMNKGIAKAQGEYLNFMNSGDCFYEKDTLQKVFGVEREGDVLYGDVYCECDDVAKNFIITYPICLDMEFWETQTINHQSSFVRKRKNERFLYDEKYKIASDRKMWIQCYISDCIFEKLDFIVSCYDFTGLSSVNAALWKKEHCEILKELLPYYVKRLYAEQQELKKQMELHALIVRYNPELVTAYDLIKKGKNHKRMLRLVLKILSFF